MGVSSFPKNYRILNQKDYQEILKKNTYTKGKYWGLIIKKNEYNIPRLGVIVAKKNYNKAVDRNRFKRIAREVFRVRKNKLGNFDFVVMKKKTANVNNKILTTELNELFSKYKKI